METIGNLIDKLTIVNLKIWKLEDIKRDPNGTDKTIADATRKTNVLNPERNAIIQSIDELVNDLISGKRQMPSYKQGDTKIYGN
jgi:hypothetical protein